MLGIGGVFFRSERPDELRAWYAAHLGVELEPPTAERLTQIKAPTLVVIGSLDGKNLQNIADTLAAKIPRARKVTIHGASHHPPVETPKEFNRILLDFLREARITP